MKNLAAALCMLTFAAGAVPAMAQTSQAKTSADELRQIENDWAAADKAKDSANSPFLNPRFSSARKS